MNSKPTVCIIGGGIAGLSAAVFLAKDGFKIKLFEASPKPGGRAYSFFDKTLNAVIDNGQHIFASWYRNTFEFLKIIGSFDKLDFQKKLRIEFLDLNAGHFSFKCPELKAPLHLLAGLMKFNAIGLKDKMAAIRFVNGIKADKIATEKLRAMNTAELFVRYKLSRSLIEAFWKPFIIAVFNAVPERTSAYMFAEMIKMGFMQKGNSELVLPNEFLSDLYVEPALEFLKKMDGEVYVSESIKKLEVKDGAALSAELNNGEKVEADYFLSAVPFYSFDKLLDKEIFEREFINTAKLKVSPILNIHMKFAEEISGSIVEKFYGIISAKLQWIFRVSSDQICIVISAAEEISELDKEEITDICKNELYQCLPELKKLQITGMRVLKEMRATFQPDPDSLNNRPVSKTAIKNFYIAGDWTQTRLPATIEGAVLSARTCADSILEDQKRKKV